MRVHGHDEGAAHRESRPGRRRLSDDDNAERRRRHDFPGATGSRRVSDYTNAHRGGRSLYPYVQWRPRRGRQQPVARSDSSPKAGPRSRSAWARTTLRTLAGQRGRTRCLRWPPQRRGTTATSSPPPSSSPSELLLRLRAMSARFRTRASLRRNAFVRSGAPLGFPAAAGLSGRGESRGSAATSRRSVRNGARQRRGHHPRMDRRNHGAARRATPSAQHHPDPYAGDEPLFVIDAANRRRAPRPPLDRSPAHAGDLSDLPAAGVSDPPERLRPAANPRRHAKQPPPPRSSWTTATGSAGAVVGIPFPIPKQRPRGDLEPPAAVPR